MKETNWKDIATKLVVALESTPYDQCEHLDHARGDYHDWQTPCPVVARNKAALEAFYSANTKKKHP